MLNHAAVAQIALGNNGHVAGLIADRAIEQGEEIAEILLVRIPTGVLHRRHYVVGHQAGAVIVEGHHLLQVLGFEGRERVVQQRVNFFLAFVFGKHRSDGSGDKQQRQSIAKQGFHQYAPLVAAIQTTPSVNGLSA